MIQGKPSATVVRAKISCDLPAIDKAAFERRCCLAGHTMADVVRLLVERYNAGEIVLPAKPGRRSD